MVEIQIVKNQGITSAIRAKLDEQGYDTSKLTGSVWTKVMQEVSAENAKNLQEGKEALYEGGSDLSGDTHKNFVVHAGPLEIAQNLWNKIVALVTGKQTVKPAENNVTGVTSAGRVNNVEQVNLTKDVKTTEVEPPVNLKKDVNIAQATLTKGLAEMSSEDLADIGLSEAKRDRMLNYIKNIHYNADGYGSAQAIENGIWVSSSCTYSSPEDLVKLLMHEANHCDENYLFNHPEESDINDTRHRDANGQPLNSPRINSVEEEKACEKIALLTTAKLIDKGVLSGKNYAPYAPPEQFRTPGEDLAKYNVTNYLTDNSQLENDLSGWIERSYPGLVENLSGDVTIRHPMQKSGFEIKSGDVVKIGGKEYTIGQDGCYLSAAGRTTVCQLAFHNGDNVKGIAGGIILNGMEPTQSELQSLYNPANPLVKLNADGTYALNQNNTAVQIIRDGKVIYSGNC